MSYTHSLRVRYSECDMQKVVFNANYWAYCDDAVDLWMRRALAVELKSTEESIDILEVGFDFMTKKVIGTFIKGVVFGDTVDMVCSVSRWGNTSFDTAIDMQVNGETCFEAVITYVSVGVQSRVAVQIPDIVRRALDRRIS